jgi:N-acetylglucosamine kinase-like BadF-type ATPase
MGGVIIIRISQIVAVINGGGSSEEKNVEIAQIGLSIVTFIVVVGGAFAILRFIGGNLIQIALPLFGISP